MSGEPIDIMKPFTRATSLFALALAVCPAQAQLPATPASLQALKVQSGELPVFPQEMLQMGVREGEVRVAFSVDHTGKVEDILAVAYTHPEFARASVATLRKWKFEPARFNGQPIGAATEVTVRFEVQGTVVVSLSLLEAVSTRLQQLTGGVDAYRPRTLQEIDRLPTPISAPSPAFPARIAESGAPARVRVSFYIDETGAVRLPSVNASDDPELGAVAIEALRNWKFEPPTCKGRPVLVRAVQEFDFRAQEKTKPATTASSG